MLYLQISQQLRQRAELLLSGQFDRLIAGYAFPLPVFLHSSCLVIQSPDHARLVLAHLRAALLDRGVATLRPSVSAIDLPRAGRFRVWVDWEEATFPADTTCVSQAVYYCRTTDLGLLIEMVNYTHLPMPELNQQFAALALSA